MCGIAGILANKPIPKGYLPLMLDAVKHRGPDSSGVFVDDGVALGHRRLSIVDLGACSNQPMSYLERYTIVYNGEIYNFQELKQELLDKGYAFTTAGDTEVILAAYDFFGQDCLWRLNGMWAFAIYDKLQKTVFCARDRFGVKPFYYSKIGDFFVFGSEIKQFVALENFDACVDEEAVYNFLQNALIDYNQNTFFRSIKQLCAGEKLLYDLQANSYSISKWYEPQTRSADFLELFRSAVSLRLRADVSVGSCLSGGLDSSSIVSMADDVLSDKRLDCVSACYADKNIDESLFIDGVASQKNIASHKIYPDLDRLLDADFLKKTIYAQDVPYASTSIFAQFCVFERAKDLGIKVMLDGQGADEILGGYNEYFYSFLSECLVKFQFGLFTKEVAALSKMHGISKFYLIARALFYTLPAFIKKLVKPAKSAWLNTDLFKNIDVKFPYIDYGERSSNLAKMSLAQIFHTNLPALLHYEDRNSMFSSVESRLPFLDYRLVEFLLCADKTRKIHRGQTKRILREALAKILPAIISSRKDKIGFATPEALWFKKHHVFLRDELALAAQKSKYINEKILSDFDAFISGKQAYSGKFWRVIAYAKWLEVFGGIE